MTDLRGTAATMVVEAEVAGRLSIRDQAGHLVAELSTPGGRVIELGLDPGEYAVTLNRPPRVFQGRIHLKPGGRARLGPSVLVAQAAEPTLRRGGPEPELQAAAPHAYRVVPVDLSIVPALSFSGRRENVVNYLALSLVYGDAARLRGVAIANAASLVREDVGGAQLSAGFNFAGSSLRGAQISAGANLALGRVVGAQATAGFNLAGPRSVDLQVAAGANLAGAGSRGGQLAAGVNWAEDAYDGLRIAAGLNRRGGRSRGAQLGAGANLAGDYRGLQLSGGLNLARALDGAQIGVINVGGDLHGAQIGVVNVARHARGLQLGVVNVAEDSTASLGVLNLIKHGEHHLELWGSETIPLALSAKLGGRRCYGILTAGMNPGTDRLRSAYGAGLGVHTPLGRAFVDVDAMSLSVHRGDELHELGTLNTLRLTFGYRAGLATRLLRGPVAQRVRVTRPGQPRHRLRSREGLRDRPPRRPPLGGLLLRRADVSRSRQT